MILSMTGYGTAMTAYKEKKIHVEIKSLNNKTLDVTTRISPVYKEKEMMIRRKIATSLVRGKVEFSIWIERAGGSAATHINGDVVGNYYEQITAIAADKAIPEPKDWFAFLLRMPDVMAPAQDNVLYAEEWAAAESVIDSAISALISFRRQEGAALEKKFKENIVNISSLLKQIEPFEESRVQKIRSRIVDNLETIIGAGYDENRLEQELIYYIERLDISEEKQRLANHLKYFTETLAETKPQGKKLGFIAQEMGREINTMGSKSNHAEMQNIVVRMKDELEQIKEQVFNVL